MKRAGLLSSLVFAGAAACGGSAPNDLFAPTDSSQFTEQPGSSGSSGGSKSSSGASGSSGTASSSSGGSSTSSSSSGGSSTSSSSSSSSGGSSSSSGGSSSSSSSGGVWKSPGIFCGDTSGSPTYCTPSAQLCCATRDIIPPPPGGGDANGINLTCDPSGIASCVTGLAIKCDDETDCGAGEVCCGQLDATGYRSVSCQASCASTPLSTAVRFCDAAAPTDQCASIGKSCQSSTRLPGYSVCQ